MKDYKNYLIVYSNDDRHTFSVAIIPASFSIEVKMEEDMYVTVSIYDRKGEFLILNMLTLSKDFNDYFREKEAELSNLVTNFLLEAFKTELDFYKSDVPDTREIIDFDIMCEKISAKLLKEFEYRKEMDKFNQK